MEMRHTPVPGPRYWAALTAASVFGANMGDFVAHNLGMGHARGLLPLAAILAGVLFAERRARGGGEVFYWLAIVVVRTAATNLADLATHDGRIAYPLVIVALAALLAMLAVVGAREVAGRAARPGMPATDGLYWVGMLTAGTLGTAAGDYVADGLGLGAGVGTLALGVVLAAMFVVRGRPGPATIASYWSTVVAARAAGTTAGDFLAGHDGLALGLPVSTTLTGLALLGILLAWRPSRAEVPFAA